MVAIPGVGHGEHPAIARDMADIVKQYTDDDRVLPAVLLGKGGALQHVFGERHVLAQVLDGRHVFEDGRQAIDDRSGHQAGALHAACIIALRVERSPSISA